MTCAVYPNTHLDDVDSDLFVLKIWKKMYTNNFLSLVLFVGSFYLFFRSLRSFLSPTFVYLIFFVTYFMLQVCLCAREYFLFPFFVILEMYNSRKKI